MPVPAHSPSLVLDSGIYFFDPEDNLIEVYLDTPRYVTQPHGDPLDLEKSDDVLWAETEQACRKDPTFMPIGEWRARFGKTTT